MLFQFRFYNKNLNQLYRDLKTGLKGWSEFSWTPIIEFNQLFVISNIHKLLCY